MIDDDVENVVSVGNLLVTLVVLNCEKVSFELVEYPLIKKVPVPARNPDVEKDAEPI